MRSENKIVFHSLKKRNEDLYSTKTLKRVILLSLWKWTRQHSYEIIKRLMIEVGIPEGKHRAPKGLRHDFGVTAISKGIHFNILQKWMRHYSDIKVTAIYTNAVGKEESEVARTCGINSNMVQLFKKQRLAKTAIEYGEVIINL